MMYRQAGISLVELLVGLVISLIVIAASTSIYLTTTKTTTDLVRSIRLEQELETLMEIMVSDIRRAGYWNSTTVSAAALSTNPFTLSTTNVRSPSTGCLLFTYDVNGNGIADANEGYGFWRDTTSGLQAVRMLTDCAPNASSCGSCTTSGGAWNLLSDEKAISITNLDFAINTQCVVSATAASPCPITKPSGRYVETRLIDITLTGRLVDDPAVVKTLNTTVKVRNNNMVVVP